MVSIVFTLGFSLGAGIAQAFVPVATLNFNNGYTSFFGNVIAANSAFSDYFTFTLPSYSTGSGATDVIAGLGLSSNGVSPNIQFTNFELDKVGSANGLQLISQGTYSPLAASPNSIASLPFQSLVQGATYALNIAGTSINPLGGSYSGNISLNVMTVPEPSELGFMLAGFGFVNILARFIKRKTAASNIALSQ